MPAADILAIAEKPYESRSQADHAILNHHLAPYLLEFSENELKIATFFLEVVVGQCTLSNTKYCLGTVVLSGYDSTNPECEATFQRIDKQTSVKINHKNSALIIDSRHLQKCALLRDSSIEEEMQFFQKSKYFSSVPRRMYPNLFKNCSIRAYSTNQTVYAEGSVADSLYFVRKGQFSILRSCEHRRIEVFDFGPDHIFGHEIQDDSDGHEGKDDELQDGRLRKSSVKCKVSCGILYCIPREYYESTLQKYSLERIKKAELCTRGYIEQSYERQKRLLLSQSLKMSMSTQLLRSERGTKMSAHPSGASTSRLKQEDRQRVCWEGRSKKFDSRLRSKLEELQMKDSEYNELKRLNEKKQKCLTMRALSKPAVVRTKGEILFGLFKTSWQFDRQLRIDRKR